MRIRKHAWKILGTGNSLPLPQPPSALLAEVSSSGYICVLNQSPWDVFPSPSPHNPQVGGWMGEGIHGEHAIFAVTSTTGVPSGQVPAGVEQGQCEPNLAPATQKSKNAMGKRVTMKKERGYESISRAGVEEGQCEPNLAPPTQKSKNAKGKRVTVKKESGYDSISRAGVEEEQCKLNLAPPTQKSKKAKGKRATVKKKSGYDSTSRDAALTYPCKKTDGKQWQCRRPAHKPNSLCDYHLTQIKSYSCKALSVAKARSVHKSAQRKGMTTLPATSAVSEIYYYSSFGPWRGKQRGGGDSGQHGSAVATADGELASEEKSCDNMHVTGDAESSEVSELEEKQKMSDTDPQMGSRKKRRKPVKSRSLKSLM